MGKIEAGEGMYSATYSGIPVYEFQFGADLKEHVMRRRQDNWINATHILKAAGFDKPARTRILEREVQKDVHEKIQGGYGKYQGTWIPLESGVALARRNNIYDRLRVVFEFAPGGQSPPPAPRHASKPKAPRRPAVPKWTAPPVLEVEPIEVAVVEDNTPDNVTVASVSHMAEDDHLDLPQPSTGQRKRKKVDTLKNLTEQQHALFGDELFDYFILSSNEKSVIRPEPPPNFQPDWVIDSDSHTALHWASAMGDVEVIQLLKRFGPTLSIRNVRGETAFMRAVNFTNCYEKKTFPRVMNELFETVEARDSSGCTVLHHAAVMKNGRVMSHSCSRYYVDNILNKLQETLEPALAQQLIDAQDEEGNTALHLAAQRNARKCIRALLGRKASTDIVNHEGVKAEDLILSLNSANKERSLQRSSSPFAPDSQPRRASFRSVLGGAGARLPKKLPLAFQSSAAATVQSRITPLMLDKFQSLAQSYDDAWAEKQEAEREARRILANTQAELATTLQQIAEVEGQLEPEEVASQLMNEAQLAKHQILRLIRYHNRMQLQQDIDQELGRSINGGLLSPVHGSSNSSSSIINGHGHGNGHGYGSVNGNGGNTVNGHGIDHGIGHGIAHGLGNGYGHGFATGIELGTSNGGLVVGTDFGAFNAERVGLARELRQLLMDQRQAEDEYVEALSMVGTSDKIESYRRLLRRCLDPKDGDSLDGNLDSLIDMMEEESSHNGLSVNGEA